MWPPSRWVDGMVLVGEMVGWAAWWWEWGQTQDEIIWEGREQICSGLPLKWTFPPTIGNMKLFDQIAKLRRLCQHV